MRASFPPHVIAGEPGREMASILSSCVHCGFCNATCPTYQIRGDELDGPRGRIYLMKSMLEESTVTASTQQHLDRCLTCRSCETTCPSGVHYSRLLDLARPMMEEKVERSVVDRARRWLIRRIVPYPRRFGALMRLGHLFAPFLPRGLAELLPKIASQRPKPPVSDTNADVVLLRGCAQRAVAPQINDAAAEIFESLGITAMQQEAQTCCGAVAFHLGNLEEARTFARRNIDLWAPQLERGTQAVVSASSGCSIMLKEYAQLLRDDQDYALRAKQVSDAVRDPSELIDPTVLADHYRASDAGAVAFHPPCTLQHGLRFADRVRDIIAAAGFTMTSFRDTHLCCGSAGSYSLLQKSLGDELLNRKIAAIADSHPSIIATANIGCQMHLQRRAQVPVVHWLELIRPHRVGP